MKLYLLPFLFCYLSAEGQISQSSEVDSLAEPRGGRELFNLFMEGTLRKPIQAEAIGIGGTVLVSGVVETDGRIADVKVVQGFRPDCDREAVRVFSLFNAWKSAQKNGQAVQQQVTVPVVFPPNTPFSYVNGTRIDYYESDFKIAADTSRANYKRTATIDTNGIPINEVVFYRLKKKEWLEYLRRPVVHYKNTVKILKDNIVYYTYAPSYKLFSGKTFITDASGHFFGQTSYQNGEPGPQLIYHLNGSVFERTEGKDKQLSVSEWYDSGQIKLRKLQKEYNYFEENDPEELIELWDSTGRQLVKKGNGQAVYQTWETSYADTTQQTLLVEQGLYRNGFKEGVWKGRYADGSYSYEEIYNKGICQSGKAYSVGADTVRYNTVEQQPDFPGGSQGIRSFLSKNLQYPREARKAGAHGQVIVSFMVCTDGTLCNYEVLKNVQPDLDSEAIRAVQRMSGQWKPGIQRGRKVQVSYKLPVNFELY